MKEFEVIHQYFQQHPHKRTDVILGSGDDCALLKPPKDQLLASTIDMMLEGVHFLPNTPPEHIAYKAIAISLSDLAAMGAEPAWVIATLSIPSIDSHWMENFTKGLFELIDQHNLALVGGDLVKGPLSISTQITGFVPPNKAIKRQGAQPGDHIYVTGTLGDARCALDLLRANQTPTDYFLNRLYRPTPRVTEGIYLRNIATAAIDLSDGLLGDLSHMLKPDGLGADIQIDNIPTTDKKNQHRALNAGDDYELCFTVRPDKTDKLDKIDCTCIGRITNAGKINCYQNGQPIEVTQESWQHF